MSSISSGELEAGRPVDARWFIVTPLLFVPLLFVSGAREGLTLVFGTFVSEDVTCILAGVMVSLEQVSWLTALLGCGIGIFVSDLLLWVIGLGLAQGLFRWPRLLQRLKNNRFWKRSQSWVKQRGGRAILMARFIPGSRLPIYLTAGLLQLPWRTMVGWTLLGTLIWTPSLVGLVVLINTRLGTTLEKWFGSTYLGFVVAATVSYVVLRLVIASFTGEGWYRWQAWVSRLWRWEFWPTWLFYLPLLPHLARLSWRYRSFTVWTAANPGIPLGGLVGESKSAILAKLPAESILPTRLLPADNDRLLFFDKVMQETSWVFPLIAKPDQGQRGEGLKKIHSREEMAHYLARHTGDCIVQPFHPGPYEAGIFYYRHPDEAEGHLFSITDKRFPSITGDGQSALKELLWKHSRYRMQATRFLTRFSQQADRVLEEGETMTLAVAGNHCQGTLFLDGCDLITPALEQRIDLIAKSFPGFSIGRFDVRYSDVDAFRRGEDLAIVELNGVTSESTNIYDPRRTLWQAYRTLAEQWSLLYAIGEAHRQQGRRVPKVTEVLRTVWHYYRTTTNSPLGD
jgi:membrane protein DedA with SNARE-associated domain